jgi:hypothetical protein
MNHAQNGGAQSWPEYLAWWDRKSWEVVSHISFLSTLETLVKVIYSTSFPT